MDLQRLAQILDWQYNVDDGMGGESISTAAFNTTVYWHGPHLGGISECSKLIKDGWNELERVGLDPLLARTNANRVDSPYRCVIGTYPDRHGYEGATLEEAVAHALLSQTYFTALNIFKDKQARAMIEGRGVVTAAPMGAFKIMYAGQLFELPVRQQLQRGDTIIVEMQGNGTLGISINSGPVLEASACG